MAAPEALAEALVKSADTLAETLATFQGFKFARAPKLKLSKFKGTPVKPGDCTLNEWLEELDFYCRQLELSEQEQVNAAIDHLGGVAKDEISCYPLDEIDTLPKLTAVLVRMFGPPSSVAVLTSEFHARSQREGETLAEFSRAIMLIHDSMEKIADAPERAALRVMRDKALKERFIQGSMDPGVRRELRRMHIDKPDLSFYKFRGHVLELFPDGEEKSSHKSKCRRALACDDVPKVHRERDGSANVTDVLSDLLTTNKLMVEKLDALCKNQSTTGSHLAELTKVLTEKLDKAIATRGKPRITCDFCKKMGHTEKNCWEKHGRPKQTGTNVKAQENSSPLPQ